MLRAAVLWLSFVAGCTGQTPAASGPKVQGPQVVGFDLDVSDLGAEAGFLGQLGFSTGPTSVLEGQAFAHLTGVASPLAQAASARLGDEALRLVAYDRPARSGLLAGSRSNDLGFQHVAIVVSDLPAACAAMARGGASSLSARPTTLPPSNPIQAAYFHDADGHALVLIAFPPGEGDPRWQRKDRLFLGIDHSAIAIADMDRSLHFYRDVLGLHATGESLHARAEQEALSGVTGARVRITELRGSAGPGVELLERLGPKDGVPLPPSAAADRLHWEIAIETTDVDALLAHAPVATTAVGVAGLGLGGSRAAVLRDPDGHAVRVVEP